MQENDAFTEHPPPFLLDRPPKLMQHFTINLWRYCGLWCHEVCQQNSLAVPEYCSHHFSVRQCLFKFLGLVGRMRVHPLFRLLFGLCIHELFPSLVASHISVKKFVPFFPVALKKRQGWPHSLSFVKVGQLFWYPPCTELVVTNLSVTIRYKVVLEICGNSSESSDIVKRRFPRTHWSTFWKSSSVTVDCRPWPPSSCASVRPSLNFLHHSRTVLSLITLSPYTRHNRRWISAALCPSAWRKRRERRWHCPYFISIYSYTTQRKCIRVCVQQEPKLLVSTKRTLWRYDNAFIFTNQSEVDFAIAYVEVWHFMGTAMLLSFCLYSSVTESVCLHMCVRMYVCGTNKLWTRAFNSQVWEIYNVWVSLCITL